MAHASGTTAPNLQQAACPLVGACDTALIYLEQSIDWIGDVQLFYDALRKMKVLDWTNALLRRYPSARRVSGCNPAWCAACSVEQKRYRIKGLNMARDETVKRAEAEWRPRPLEAPRRSCRLRSIAHRVCLCRNPGTCDYVWLPPRTASQRLDDPQGNRHWAHIGSHDFVSTPD